MIECYLKSVEDRNKRYTAAMCQDEILSDFARNKITVDVDCMHMLIYNARM